eukprot:6173188-Pleurochrysis_carterae.AAC.3
MKQGAARTGGLGEHRRGRTAGTPTTTKGNEPAKRSSRSEQARLTSGCGAPCGACRRAGSAS